jgi:hypothetical protein
LWPWRTRLEEARRPRWDLCREEERLGPVRRSVDAFEVERQRVKELMEIIERLKAEGPAKRDVPPDALAEPGPEPVPTPRRERGTTTKRT